VRDSIRGNFYGQHYMLKVTISRCYAEQVVRSSTFFSWQRNARRS